MPFLLRFIGWAFPKLEFLIPPLARRFAVFLFFTPFRYPETHNEKAAITRAETYSLQINDRTVYYYTWGNGEPVIFCHGWSGRGAQCHKFIDPLLDNGYQLIALDAPSHGRSAGKRTDIYEYEKALFSIAEKHQQPVNIISHSFGGVVGIYAIKEGLKVKKLITIGSPTVADYIVEEFIRRLNGSPGLKEYFLNFILKKYGKPFESVSMVKMVSEIDPFPMLMIHDRDDKEVPFHHFQKMQDSHQWIETMITEDLGHHKILKNPEVIKACVAFLNQS